MKFLAKVFLNGDNNDCNIDKRDEENLLYKLKEVWHQKKKFTMTTSSETLKRYIGKLNNEVGHDGLHSQLLRHATYEFLVQLSLSMNACFNHCYISVELLKGDINPIIY